jgi:hypothetical protein
MVMAGYAPAIDILSSRNDVPQNRLDAYRRSAGGGLYCLRGG